MPVYEKHGRVGAKGFLGPGRRHEKAGDNRFRVGTPTKLGLRAGKGRVSGGGNIYVGAGGGWHFRSLSADLYRGVGDPLYGRPEDVMYGAGSGMHYTAAALMLRRNPKPAVRGRLYAVGIGDAPAMAVPHTTAADPGLHTADRPGPEPQSRIEPVTAVGQPIIKLAPRDALLYEAAEALRRAALAGAADAVGPTATLLHRMAQGEADRRPRHAAIALAAWDALTCTDQPFGTPGRRHALWDVAQTLLLQFISTEHEMALLDRMDAAGLERVPPFEDTLVGSLFDFGSGDEVR